MAREGGRGASAKSSKEERDLSLQPQTGPLRRQPKQASGERRELGRRVVSARRESKLLEETREMRARLLLQED